VSLEGSSPPMALPGVTIELASLFEQD
jgi:hypothetical protein